MTSLYANNRAARGFSLTELAIVLGIIGIVLAGLWGTVSLVREHLKREETLEQMVSITTKIRDHYLGRACASTTFACNNNEDLTNDLMDKNVLLAEQYRTGSNPRLADHPWGDATGAGTLVVRSVGDGRRFFSIELNRLPQDSCAALAPKLSGTGAPTGLTGAWINGAGAAFPVTPETALGACSNAAATNVILLQYALRP